jgi:hypothetical protein
VLHCFSGSIELLNSAIELGFHVSFTGNVTFKKSILDEVVRAVPDDRYMIETDSPYISPVPYRGKRNEPAHVKLVAEKIAAIRNQTIEEVIFMTTQNARRFFGILLLLFFLVPPLFSQSEEQIQSEPKPGELIHPYPKVVGVTFVGALNTIYEDREWATGKGGISWEGLFAYGAAVDYALSDHLMIEGTYLYSKNKKVVRDSLYNKDGQANPNVHQVAELALKYMPNPYSRVTFYGTGGISYFLNDYNGGDAYKDSLQYGQRGFTLNTLGIAAGIGVFININSPVGVFTPGGEWRVDFHLSSRKQDIVVAGKLQTSVTIHSFFSLPRFYLLWYPKF